MNENVSTYNVFCKQISAHESNHRLYGDESPRGSTNHVRGRIFSIFEKQQQQQQQKPQNNKQTEAYS